MGWTYLLYINCVAVNERSLFFTQCHTSYGLQGILCITPGVSNSFGAVGHTYTLRFYTGHPFLHMTELILSSTFHSYHCDTKKLDIFLLLEACSYLVAKIEQSQLSTLS